MATIQELYKFYDITPDMQPSCNTIENLKISFPELYSLSIEDPYPISELIDHWDLYYSTNTRTEYILRRKWTYWMAIREYIQNALDEQEIVHGTKSLKDVKIFIDKYGFHIRDYGRGLSPRHFRMGGTEKEEWQRGYFGTGMKEGALFLLTQGDVTYVFTGDIVYKTILYHGTMYLIIGRSKIMADGTDVIVYGPDVNKLNEIARNITFYQYVEHNKDRIIDEYNVLDKTYPTPPNVIRENTVIDTGEVSEDNKLFIDDIYVSTFGEQVDKKSLFTYNLWYVKLEPNRRRVLDISKLKSKIEEVLYRAIYNDDKILKFLGDYAFDVSGRVIQINDDFFEFPLIYEGQFYDYLEKVLGISRNKIVSIDSLTYVNNYLYIVPSDVYLIVLDSYDKREVFSNIKDISTFINEQSKNEILQTHKNKVKLIYIPYMLLYSTNIILPLLINLPSTYTIDEIHFVKKFNDKNTYAMYFSNNNSIVISVKKILDKYGGSIFDTFFTRILNIFIHEAAHSSGCGDISHCFEESLSEVSSEMVNYVINRTKIIKLFKNGFMLNDSTYSDLEYIDLRSFEGLYKSLYDNIRINTDAQKFYNEYGLDEIISLRTYDAFYIALFEENISEYILSYIPRIGFEYISLDIGLDEYYLPYHKFKTSVYSRRIASKKHDIIERNKNGLILSHDLNYGLLLDYFKDGKIISSLKLETGKILEWR